MAQLELQGHDVCRLKIVAPGEAKPRFTDLYDAATGTLIEAKGSVRRESMRMAVSQRRLPAPRRQRPQELAVLVPSEPRPDLLDLVAFQEITPSGEAQRWSSGASRRRSLHGANRDRIGDLLLQNGASPPAKSRVEPTGIEPVTSCLQSRRSPS
jgi:hypothetical protein